MAILDDAVELVCWFESQPDYKTYKKDEHIAAALGWFVKQVGTKPDNSRGKKGTRMRLGMGAVPGDARRVRNAKRYVDNHNDQQPFLGYAFGTKRNGAGVRITMLYTPKGDSAAPIVDESTSEQIGRAVQAANQHLAERARMIAKFNQDKDAYLKAGEVEKAMVVHDCIRDLELFGVLNMTTLQNAKEAGVLTRVGAS